MSFFRFLVVLALCGGAGEAVALAARYFLDDSLGSFFVMLGLSFLAGFAVSSALAPWVDGDES